MVFHYRCYIKNEEKSRKIVTWLEKNGYLIEIIFHGRLDLHNRNEIIPLKYIRDEITIKLFYPLPEIFLIFFTILEVSYENDM